MLYFDCRSLRSRIAMGLVLPTLIAAGYAQVPDQVPNNDPPAAPAPSANSNVQPVPSNNGAVKPATPETGPASADSTNQEPGTNDQGGMFVFKKDVEEVVLHATVFDEQRRVVPDLDRGAFTVLENGIPQTITSFHRQDVPVAMGIVIDNSGSMRSKRDEVNRAVLNLIRASNPQDEIFVVNFSQNSILDQDFTSNVDLLQAALHQVSARGSTALYDAVVASAVHLENDPRLEKKILLVITDGQDNMSQETLQEALHRLQERNGPTLYAIGLMGGDLHREGREALQKLAESTGGVAYFPQTLDQVADITGTVAHDIRSQYLIVYRPQNQNVKPDDRSIHVEAHAQGRAKLIVNARSGYQHRENPTH